MRGWEEHLAAAMSIRTFARERIWPFSYTAWEYWGVCPKLDAIQET
jgi:hypothetical protein